MFGPPGAGKGTYATKLAERFGLSAIATGDIFRAEVKSNSALGKKVANYLQSGKLVPDNIVNGVLEDCLSKPESSHGVILDGYPRTVEQAKALDAITKIDAIITLAVPEWVVVERLSNRRICRSCGAIYNIKYSPKPKVDLKCDKCGGELYQREDDRAEVIRERLRVYERQTQPLIDYYKKKRAKFITIKNIQVDSPINEVFQEISDGLKQAKLV
ncbi:MAG TPA: adenylate kinase [Candidatus Bathyarchaeia archaeon]|nr:adenylate kinase [Candidatus Bathyarchaeia archaeon]